MHEQTKTRTKEADRKKNLQGSLPRPSMKVRDAAALAYSEGHGLESWLPLESNLVLQLTFISDNTIKVINSYYLLK